MDRPCRGQPSASREFDTNRLRRTQRLRARRLDRLVAGQRHAHAPLAADLGLAEQTQRRVELGEQRRLQIAETYALRLALDHRITAEADGPTSRFAGIGRPRIARACRANSERSWEISVTRPVSWGRGDTSLNHT